MIVGVCGFSWSGSGAVIDYLMEFKENQVYDREFLLAYHPDGLVDLDFQLNQNCSKFLSSSVAIPRFRQFTRKTLNGQTKGEITKLTEDYLSKLIQAEWIGDAAGQYLLHENILYLYDRLGGVIYKYILNRLPRKRAEGLRLYPMTNIQISLQPDDFLEITRSYVDEILKSIGLNSKYNIVLNQPFPGNNPQPSMKYFRDSKAIVVDRDPRDLFAYLNVYNPKGSYSIPYTNVDDFIKYYRAIRRPERPKSEKTILYVKFEDMIYNYDSTTERIRDFLGLKQPSKPMEYFVPRQSMANTLIFRKHPELSDSIKRIEKELKEYLFDFQNYDYNPESNRMFDDNPRSESYNFRR
jgi:hypothetical protein